MGRSIRMVLITRPAAECTELEALLEPCNIDVIPFPVLREREVDDERAWDRTATSLADSSAPRWLVLTSARAASAVVKFARLHQVSSLLELPTAAVGTASARAAEAAGLNVAIVGNEGGAALAERLASHWAEPTTAIFACGRDHRRELPDGLLDAGHRVLELVVYFMETIPEGELPSPDPSTEAVILTSPRSADAYLQQLGGRPLSCAHWALGATTRDAAADLGINCRIPAEPNLKSLAEELCLT